MFLESAPRIAQQLKDSDATVSVAESSTGGLISANLLAVPGASSYFMGGSVVYTRESRRAFLELEKDQLRGLEPMTPELVQEFAHAARETLGTTWGIAELGATGPAGSPYGYGPGTSVIGISGPVNKAIKIETHSDNRQDNMIAFTEAALDLFEEVLSQS
jgi:PncC family amidohydrolase